MILRVYTVKFSGSSGLTCRRCQKRVDFEDDQWLILLDTGESTRVYSAIDLVTVHRCGREMVWWCPTCRREVEDVARRGYRRRGLRAGTEWVHQLCGERIQQREHRVPA